MRKGTQKYLDYIENNSKREFKIICISSCNGAGLLAEQEVKKGEIFNTNNYEFNYITLCGGNHTRLFRNGKIIGLFNQENFMKIEDYRDKIIEDLIK